MIAVVTDHDQTRARRRSNAVRRFGIDRASRLRFLRQPVSRRRDLLAWNARYVVGTIELSGAVLVLGDQSALSGTLLLFDATLFAAFHVVSIGHSLPPRSILVALTGGPIIVERRLRG